MANAKELQKKIDRSQQFLAKHPHLSDEETETIMNNIEDWQDELDRLETDQTGFVEGTGNFRLGDLDALNGLIEPVELSPDYAQDLTEEE